MATSTPTKEQTEQQLTWDSPSIDNIVATDAATNESFESTIQRQMQTKHHNKLGAILSNKRYKYRYIIAPLLSNVRTKQGKGMPLNMMLSNRKIEYAHWDDPNDLVDRLRLLDASRQAGIFRDNKQYPNILQTDRGKEFYNIDVQTLIKKHDINHYSTYSVMKASIVERFNRTLKNDMWKHLTLTGTYKWIDTLPRLLMEYNARNYRTIGMQPIDVTPAIAEKLLTTVYSNVKIAGPARFKVGDSDSRGQSVAGGFYEYELHCVAHPDVYLVEKVLRKKGDKVYVKWLGLDKSYNSWINKTNVL
ncbi:uncharacterized protein LOC109859845 [Pseudomyrmex gracilis]|uniref:uncharacterized protein LOC109859845 n=1 Tax=Pseudomyrmex gracilis TaxID=219809 RepID=UPI000995324C|nr:uncharacterized protein LOC109859845 [Pseudomyrmex gracilis]